MDSFKDKRKQQRMKDVKLIAQQNGAILFYFWHSIYKHLLVHVYQIKTVELIKNPNVFYKKQYKHR